MYQEDPEHTSHPNLPHMILEKAFQDQSFLQSLRESPKEAIASHLSVEIPDSVNVHVVEETEEDVYLVLPRALTGGLQDEQLEQIAAGFTRAKEFAESENASLPPSAGTVVSVGLGPAAGCGCGGWSWYTSAYPTQACSPSCGMESVRIG